MLKLPAKLYLDHPCSSSFLGTVQCCAPALKPRAVYGKAIRVIVPLKRRTDRNTTAWTRCRVSLFYRLTFFFFSSSKKFLQDPILLSAFSIYFPFFSLPKLSHPLGLSFIPLNLKLPLGFLSLSVSAPFYINSDTEGFSFEKISWNSNELQFVPFFRYHLGNKNHLTASLWNTCTVSLVPLCTRVENRSGIATDIS